MKKLRKDGSKTYQHILNVACKVFAEKGYWHATIADICKKAKTNIASVNYHFGDKKSLYVEAWIHSFRKSLSAHPPDGGVSEDAPPEKRLRARITALLDLVRVCHCATVPLPVNKIKGY